VKDKNFKFNETYYKVIKDMTDKQAGEFIKGICEYAFESKPFESKDGYLKGLFMYIKKSIDDVNISKEYGKRGASASKALSKSRQGGFVVTINEEDL
jgi:hypothetical protein